MVTNWITIQLVTIDENNKEVAQVVENTKLPPETGEFTVTKVDADNPAILLDNATFILSRDNAGVSEYYAEDNQGVISCVESKSEATNLVSEKWYIYY